MKTEKIQSAIITPKTTGYAAAAGMGLSVLSAKNKNLKNFHKTSAYVTAGLTFLHIGLIEYYNFKFKNK